MLIELHFTVNSGIAIRPVIDIYHNDELKLNNVVLDDCGSVDDPAANTKNIILNIDTTANSHLIKIQSLNISNEYKSSSDFGFQLRHVVADGVVLGTYGIDYKCVNPADELYIKHFLEPANKLHELELIDGQTMHVTKGYWANYVNLPNSWIEFKFQTPLYHWILAQQFGRQLDSLRV